MSESERRKIASTSEVESFPRFNEREHGIGRNVKEFNSRVRTVLGKREILKLQISNFKS